MLKLAQKRHFHFYFEKKCLFSEPLFIYILMIHFVSFLPNEKKKKV
jgi:hypothetical protein